MPYKKMKGELPKRSRKQPPRFESTDEWRAMKADIDKGLKPNEFLQLTLTAEDKKKIGIRNRRTIARFIQAYLAQHNLHKYTVNNFNREGVDFVLVSYQPVERQIA